MGRVDISVRRALLALGIVLLFASGAGAASLRRQCRRACTDDIASCVAEGGTRFACRKLVLGQCRRAGVLFCGGVPASKVVAVPTLTARVVTGGAVDLSWVDVTDQERNWIVERSFQATTGFASVGVTLQNVTTYRDSGLPIGFTIYYRVHAISGSLTVSPYSNVASVFVSDVRDVTPPAVPLGLTARAANCGQIDLAWAAAIDTGGAGLKGYNIYRNGALLKQVTGTSTSDGGLAASTAYGYAVSAIDNAGNQSARTAIVSATTPRCAGTDTSAPTAPGAPVLTTSGCNAMSLSWTGSTDSGGAGLKGYNVYRNGAFLKQVTATSTTDSGLAGSTVYGYAVSAIDNAGNESSRSATASRNTPACSDVTPPTVPGSVRVSPGSCSQVTVTWAASTDGGSGLKGYNVYRNSAFLRQVTGASTTDTGLSASTAYAYAVSAIDNAGNESARSAAVSTTTPTCSSAATGAQLVGCVAAIGKAQDVVVQNGLAYVASMEFGLAIADVSNPAAPRVVGVSSPPFYAERIAVSGTLAVLTGSGYGLTVVDVSDPRAPRIVSSMAGTMKGVAMVGQYAYVLVVVPGNPARTDLVIFDLRQPAAPAIAGRVTVATASELRVIGSIAFVAARGTGVQLVNVANRAAPAILGTVDTPGTAQGVAVSGNYAFVADGTAVLSIDLNRTPAAIVGSLPVSAIGVAVDGTRLYAVDGVQMKIIDVANPAAPVLRSTTSAFGALSVAATGSMAFLASTEVDRAINKGGLYVVDASVPTAPRVLANIVGGHDNLGVGVAGSIGVVAGNGLGLKVVDLADPRAPRVVGSLAGTMVAATMAGQYAYVITIVPGNPARIDLAIVDLRTPSSPVIAGRVTVAGSSLAVDGSYAYVAAGAAGLQIVDISSPTAPRIVGTLDTPGWAQGVAAAGNYAYVADGSATLVVNVTDRTRPAVVGSITGLSTALTVAGSRVYAIGDVLRIIDVTNAAAPVVRSSTTAYGAQAVQVMGSSLFLATPALNHFDLSGGVHMLDVANPAAPRLVEQIIVPGTTRSLVATNGRVYAGDSASVLDVIELVP